ncbi:MAG: hypothetical protein PWR21_853, partial [Methanoculleus sp.]|nr:hypothetical protein [Methanoculleus sp.]
MQWTVVACASDDARTPAVPPVVYRHWGNDCPQDATVRENWSVSTEGARQEFEKLKEFRCVSESEHEKTEGLRCGADGECDVPKRDWPEGRSVSTEGAKER